VELWAGGKRGNLRALLSNLHTIAWEGSDWKEVSISSLLDPSKLKLVYRIALRIVHPDKQTGKPLEQRLLAERIFEIIQEAAKKENL